MIRARRRNALVAGVVAGKVAGNTAAAAAAHSQPQQQAPPPPAGYPGYPPPAPYPGVYGPPPPAPAESAPAPAPAPAPATQVVVVHTTAPAAPSAASAPHASAASSGSAKRVAKPATPPKDWSTEEVVAFLSSISMPADVVDKFEEMEVTGEDLLTMSADELKEELGITKLQANKVKRHLAEITGTA